MVSRIEDVIIKHYNYSQKKLNSNQNVSDGFKNTFAPLYFFATVQL
jgi:hypothetical protein